MQERNAMVIDKKDEIVEKDNVVTIDYVELDESKNEIESTKRQDFVFTVGSGENLYKVDDDIIGMKKDEAKVKFIIEYAKAFEWWTKNKDKRLKTKEAKSQFAKAVGEFIAADFKNAWNSLKNDSDKGIQFMARSVDNIVKGIANDIKTKKNNNKTDKESKKDETNSRNVFSWEKYTQLCKLLFNN